MRRLVLFAVSLLLCGPVWAVTADKLVQDFRNPPPSARPHTWWHWINGNITKEGITADLEAMKRVGIGGAQIFNVDVGVPAGKVPFMSPAFREMIRHAAREASRLGIELCLHNCAGWSSSGGPWVKPEHGMQALCWSETTVHGPGRFSGVLPRPQRILRYGPSDYYRDIAVLALPAPKGEAAQVRISNTRAKAAFDRADRIEPDTSPTPSGAAVEPRQIVNLTDRLRPDERISWDVPEGDWVILRIGHAPTGKENHPSPREGLGLECDKLSREALLEHWNGMMAKILADIGPLAGKSINASLIDSYEVFSQNWTPAFREEFRRRRGYDLLPYLPVITGRVVGSIEESERFLWDFRRTVADLFAENYYGYFRELCHRSGLKFYTEPYGNGFFDDLQCGGLADMPMGEFWVGGGAIETTKLAASAGHTNGRRIIGAESFTADDVNGRWKVDPYSIKALGDLVFCQGVNRYIFHRYAHQPWLNLKPGMTMGPWGMHLERTITWWEQSAAWLRYIARCQYLLQSGLFVADVCYFCGESAPSSLPARSSLRPSLPDGYDYDGCDATVVRNRMSVRNGRIVLPDGMSYRVLVLPDSRFMTPQMARKIRDLVRAGAVVIGPKPLKSPSLSGYPRCDEEVRAIADEVWGGVDGVNVTEHAYGRGKVIWGQSLQEVLRKLGIPPDFEPATTRDGARLAYIHRTLGTAEVYFVSNQSHRPQRVACTFRVSGRVPELWHPDTGDIETAPVYEEKNGRTTVLLSVDPAGSVFVVFRRPSRGHVHLTSLGRMEDAEAARRAPRIEVRRAFYEPADGRPGGADVTGKVAQMVAQGQYSILASNSVFGDPTPNIVKRLRVEYTLDGQPMQKVVNENETLQLAAYGREEFGPPQFEVKATATGVELIPWEAGTYAFKTAGGRTRSLTVGRQPDVLQVAGPWNLRFPSGWGAPERVRLDRLMSWTEHSNPGVRHFSGTAEYTKEFIVPARMLGRGKVVLLDLGRVKNFAEVTLNGRRLGTLWKPPFRVEVTGIVRLGRNVLSVRVTNLWPNRLIGDEQLSPDVEWNGPRLARWPQWLVEGKPRPKTGRYTFTTWRFYTKDSPLLESGLIGPVTLRSVQKLVLPVR
ncbi:MAG: glycosyl hydrolase [Armatimonadota bacterium]